MLYDDATTVADVVAAWDAGESIWSVEMGGLGPGYEQCIQVLAVEIMRAYGDKPLPKSGRSDWDQWGDDVVSRLDKDFRFSGAQVGAAKHIAAQFIANGPHAAIQKAPEDRRIQVERDFPRLSSDSVVQETSPRG